MGLNLDIDLHALTSPGRIRRGVEAEVVREIRPSDLAILATSERRIKPIPTVKRMSERHHALARNLAAGLKRSEAAHICGYTDARVSILQGDPAFAELVEFYRADKDAAFASMYEQLAGLSLDLTLELRDRFETEPETFTNPQLLDMLTKLADRSGHGPSSSTTNFNINAELGDRLEVARARAKAAAQGGVEDAQLIEGEKDE